MAALSSVALMLALSAPGGSAALLPDDIWRTCPEAEARLECSTLGVPLDHADPGAATIGLPVKRMAAADPDHRIGVLIAIAGGPGQRGTDLVAPGRHPPSIRAAFDVVSWDPRGTSGETLIDCIPVWDPFDDLDRTPDTPAERDALDARVDELTARCHDRHAPILPFLGTMETALDLERLRQLLGEERISLHGTSYGSQVAVIYATLFPQHVRAVVLDGYSDPNQSPGERDLEQAATFERQLDLLLASCAAAVDCALGGADPGAALDRLLLRLDGAALVSDGAAPLLQADVYEALLASLVRDGSARQSLLRALGAAEAGDGAPLKRIADDARAAFEASGLTFGVFAAIACADDAAWWRARTSSDVLELTERMASVAPRFGRWLWPDPSEDVQSLLGICVMQPDAIGRPVAGFDAAGAGPVLVLATTGDPATPLAAAKRALADLEDARLLTVAADHHTSYGYAVHLPEHPVYGCVLDAVERYLIDSVPPPRTSTCG